MGQTVKRILGIILIGIVVAVAGALLVVRMLDDAATDVLVSKVDRFDVPADWDPVADTVRPERFLCLSTNPCPSIFRSWKATTILTAEDIQMFADPVGLSLKFSDACQPRPGETGADILCTATGTDDGYDYLLVLRKVIDDERQVISVDVRPL